jgi:hypothetical protein
MLMYVITGPEGDGFVCEDVQACLANMGEGESVYAVTYKEKGRELVTRRERGVVPEEVKP